jgi:hypothetical protein
LRLPVRGAAAAVLLALIGGVLIGHLGVLRNTLEHDAQDFGIFLTSARHDLSGRSLYQPARRRTRTGYGTAAFNLNLPHTMALVRPLARLDDRTALTVWMVGSLLLGAAASAASVRALGWRLRLLPALAMALYLIAWAPSAAVTSTAQITFYVMAPVVAAWLAARRGSSTASGAWLGLAVAMKPFLLIFVPYVILRRDRRALVAMGVVSGAIVSLGLAAYGPGAYLEWLAQLPKVTWSAHFLNASILGMLQRLFGRSFHATVAEMPALVPPVALALSLAVGVITLAVTSRVRPEPQRTDADWAALLLAALLMSPLGWNYYLWIAVWPVAAVVAARRPWQQPAAGDLWLLAGLAGWLWWGAMAGWGQPHTLATLTAGSFYFWALLSLWIWTVRHRAGAPSSLAS